MDTYFHDAEDRDKARYTLDMKVLTAVNHGIEGCVLYPSKRLGPHRTPRELAGTADTRTFLARLAYRCKPLILRHPLHKPLQWVLALVNPSKLYASVTGEPADQSPWDTGGRMFQAVKIREDSRQGLPIRGLFSLSAAQQHSGWQA